MQSNQKQLNLTYKGPILAQDLITINGKGSGEIDVLFSQVTKEDASSIEATVVASVRFPNVNALENTQKLISEAIEQIKNQEK